MTADPGLCEQQQMRGPQNVTERLTLVLQVTGSTISLFLLESQHCWA